MAGAKEIRGKIASVSSTQKITSAMEMVAASKMRKAQQRMALGKPYARRIRAVVGHIANATPEYQHLYLEERQIRRVSGEPGVRVGFLMQQTIRCVIDVEGEILQRAVERQPGIEQIAGVRVQDAHPERVRRRPKFVEAALDSPGLRQGDLKVAGPHRPCELIARLRGDPLVQSLSRKLLIRVRRHPASLLTLPDGEWLVR